MKINLIIFITVLSVLIMTACGSDKNYDHPDAYLEAIDNNDFEEAHKVLTHLYGKYIDAYNKDSYNLDRASQAYWSAADHIYKAEMQWLLPQRDPEANRRLIYTLDDMNPVGMEPVVGKMYGYRQMKQAEVYVDFVNHYNRLCMEMLRIAIHNDNREMADKLVMMFKKSYIRKESGSEYYFTAETSAMEEAKTLNSNP